MGRTVGIVGVGALGLQAAKNLIERGHKVVGYRRSPMDAFVAAGGIAATSAADVARQADLVVTLLRPEQAVEEVYFGENGILSVVRPGLIAVELSTVPMAIKRKLEAAAKGAGLALLDGTVSGNPNFFKSRTAAVFLGGEQSVFDQCAETLRDITDKVTLVGPIGSGRAAKFVALYLVAAHVLAAAEAFELAERAGLDKAAMLEAIAGSNATSAMLESRGRLMVDGGYKDYIPEKVGGTRADGTKKRGIDSRLRQIQRLNELAGALGGRYPLMHAMTAAYEAAADSGHADHDISQVIEYLKADAGDPLSEQRLSELLEHYS
ncbi:MAG: hypothetical protein RLZ98_3709 [Pseudomonadota bacterium]|jgi:3-hydroxyisobutyrate dehydrogenase-like beta-hydroxyacid dehydrogenase